MLVCFACPARAQVEAPSRVRLTWENDLFAGRDGHYTNGAAIALTGRLDPGLLPGPLAADRGEWDLELSQQIYTPEDTSTPCPAPGARLYAGYAYASLGVRRYQRRLALQDRITLTLGLVGPASGGQAAHELAHDLTGSSPAEGWARQLRDEPTVGLCYAVSPRLARVRAFGLDADLRVEVEVALGNVSTHASVIGALRLGLNVPDEYSDRAPAPLRCYLTAGLELRAVAYDIFLDGNLLRGGGPRVRKHPLVAEASLGLTLAVWDRVAFSYVHTYRTPQFHGQRAGDHFGSLSVVFSW